MPASNIVDSGRVIVAGSRVTFNITVTKDSGTYDLTGKTVHARIRREGGDEEVLDAGFETIICTGSILGVASFTLSGADSAKLNPQTGNAAESNDSYLVRVSVPTDEFVAHQQLRFYATE